MPSPTASIATTITATVEATIFARNERGANRRNDRPVEVVASGSGVLTAGRSPRRAPW